MYIKRYIYPKMVEKISEDDILLVTGARQTGKTTLLQHLKEELEAKKELCFYITLEDSSMVESLDQTPLNLFKILSIDLKKKVFVFIDEIQYLKNPSNFLKLLYDTYRGKVKLIVTGSSAFYIDKRFKDSLVGRKYIFHLSTLSLKEFIEFKEGDDILANRLSNMVLVEKERFVRYYNEYIKYGGYPKVILANTHEKKLAALDEIANTYIKKDVIEAGLKSDKHYYHILKLFASQTGGLVNKSGISVTLGVSTTLIDNYLYVMSKSFHIVLVSPFSNDRKTEITKMSKVYFLDLGLRNYFLDNFEYFDTRTDKGAILENLAFRAFYDKDPNDLFIQYWRSKSGAEVDFIIHRKDAYEIKMQVRYLNRRSYQFFIEKYPEVKFHVAVYDVGEKEDVKKEFPIVNV